MVLVAGCEVFESNGLVCGGDRDSCCGDGGGVR